MTIPKYQIREISASAVMLNSKCGDDGIYSFVLSEEATSKCMHQSSIMLQDDCALFYQIMCVLHPEGFKTTESTDGLKDVLFFMDFSRIFDRSDIQKKYKDRQAKAHDMFRPEGVTLDFGRRPYRYVAFERSASMSRNARISFIREDLYEPVRKRIMLDMEIGKCQLSKLYAYNGLMLTSGFRVDDMNIWDSKRIVIIDNPETVLKGRTIITMEDDGTNNAVRAYRRKKDFRDIKVMEFDGEGLISEELAGKVDYLCFGKALHSSFQIRMPYIKGVVHKVDFKSMLSELGVSEIKDVWGESHNVEDVDLVLTKSMFKGFGWMTENKLSWPEYIERCKNYNHALYISGVGKPSKDGYTELNYQFLTTASITGEEFRPSDLPKGWNKSPNTDSRHWLTKLIESKYYDYVASRDARIRFFTEMTDEENPSLAMWAGIIRKNPAFINETVITKLFKNKADKVLRDYAIGKLYISGDNRYLSGDLMEFIKELVRGSVNDVDLVELTSECLNSGEIYAPGAVYEENDRYTLLRNPHIARNEEAVVRPLEEPGYFRKKYMSHLDSVIMVDSITLIPERLGGADFDGDMVKTIADPLMNECVSRNYIGNYDFVAESLPVLIIPSAEPQIRDANDWEARFETIKNTFNSRIGQICNAAFDRSIVAYDENLVSEERKALEEETEELEMLTGLEIDSAKSGIKPDLSGYLDRKIVSRSPFLKYKNIVNDNPQWYEPSKKKQLDDFFASVDWGDVTSNVEKLPFLAKLLKENTPVLKSTPAPDEELFSFAKAKGWKELLDPLVMEFTGKAIEDYDSVLRRIHLLRMEPKYMRRRSDIERILFMRGQESQYSPDELYALFQDTPPYLIERYRRKIIDECWHLSDKDKRELFVMEMLSYDKQEKYMELLTDFKHHGYRILGDILCDFDDMYKDQETRENARHRDSDSSLAKHLMNAYDNSPSGDYESLINRETRKYINLRSKPVEVFKCAIALGRRDFAYKTMLDIVEKLALKGKRH